MKTKLPKTKRGFTLIEVALVLAIAGLIFLMVFQVVPTVQRNQRDTARNEILGNVQAQLMNWQTSHNGNLPKVAANPADTSGGNGIYKLWEADESFSNCDKNVACEFVRNYMNSATSDTNAFKDPDGEFFNVVVTKNVSKESDMSDLDTVTFATADGIDAGLKTDTDDELQKTYATIQTDLENTFDAHVLYIIPGATCHENEAISSKRNNFAILYYMESSGVTCRGTNS